MHSTRSQQPRRQGFIGKNALQAELALISNFIDEMEKLTSLLDRVPSNQASSYSHSINQMIKELGKMDRAIDVILLFEEAEKRQLTNSVTHNCAIHAIAKSRAPNVERALELFESAKLLGIADDITRRSVLDVLVAANRLEEALVFYVENGLSLAIEKAGHEHIIDLHGQSHGSTYVGLSHYLKSLPHVSTLTIIHGRGLHSHSVDEAGMFPVKSAVLKLLADMNIQHQPDRNPGRLVATYHPKFVSAWSKPLPSAAAAARPVSASQDLPIPEETKSNTKPGGSSTR